MSHKLVSLYIGDGEYYTRTDTDSVIADLEESHKMEVEQLLIEIVELKAQKAQAEDDCAYWKMREGNAVNAMHETEEACMFLTKSECHQKYKRCLGKAEMCGVVCDKWMMKKAKAIGLGKDGVKEYHQARRKLFHYMRWQTRWIKIAEKFKEEK